MLAWEYIWVGFHLRILPSGMMGVVQSCSRRSGDIFHNIIFYILLCGPLFVKDSELFLH